MRIPTVAGTLATLFLPVALAAQDAIPETLPEAGAVLERFVEAVGGHERLAAIHSRHLTYEMDAGGVLIEMEVKMRRPGLAASWVTTPMGPVRSGTDGKVAWVSTSGRVQYLDGRVRDEVVDGSRFDADFLFDAFPEREVVGVDEHLDRRCWRVRMTSTGGNETFRCFDVETGLLLATTVRQNGMLVTAVVEEYREVDGVRYPARTRAVVGGESVVTTLISVDHTEIPLEAFSPPVGR